MARKSALQKIEDWSGELSEDSPDWYEQTANYSPPFSVHFVKAGSRVGYQWGTGSCGCEVNWLDPEPDRESSSDYDEYIEELQRIERWIGTYRGFHQPPTEEEYRSIDTELVW